MHTTNYYNTFIHVAEDCPVTDGRQERQEPVAPFKRHTGTVYAITGRFNTCPLFSSLAASFA